MKQFIEIVKTGLMESSEFLEIPMTDVCVVAPPRIDDFDSAERITWRAAIEACKFVADRLLFHIFAEPPTEKEVLKSAKHSGAFSLLVAIHPAKQFILEALQVFTLAASDLLVSVIAHRALAGLERIEYDSPLPTAAEAVDNVLGEVIIAARELTERGRKAIAYDRRKGE